MKQYIKTDKHGSKRYYKDEAETILHREDGPAVEYAGGSKEWFINGKRHRMDGPAAEYADGDKFWFINGEFHRMDGPAIERANGYKTWYINGIFIFSVDKSGELINRME